MKTLTCQAEPNHEFQHPGGRGRPPLYCDEHKPVKKPSNSSVTVVTGVTAASEEAPVNPFIAKAKKEAISNRVAKARETREKKKVERIEQTIEEVEAEYIEIDTTIEKASKSYSDALTATREVEWSRDTEKEFNKVWHYCDLKMNGLMNVLKRKRYLEALVEKLTNPDRVDKIEVTPDGVRTASYAPTMDMDDPIGGRSDLDIEEIFARANDEAIMQEEYESQGDEHESGYNDLLSNPEQYDTDNDVAEQFAHILREFEED